MKRLKGGKPRRFKDHRRLEARPYNAAYEAIAERYPPQDRLACRIAGVAADLLVDYERLAQSKRRTARAGSARRKTAGLLLGALRSAAGGMNGDGRQPTPDELLDRFHAAAAREAAEARGRDGH